MLRLKAAEPRNEPAHRKRRERADPQLGSPPREAAQRIRNAGQRRHHRRGELLALCREFEAAAGAREQRHAEPTLQLTREMRQRRRADRELRSGADHGPGAGDRAERLHCPQG